MREMKDDEHLKKCTEKIIQDAQLRSKSKEDEFKNLSDPSDCVNIVYNCIYKLQAFKNIIAENQNRKSNKISEELRMKANDDFLRNDQYLDALEKYTESIAFAENGSSYLAIAYANRSACLFKGMFFKECVEDIDRALSLDYPEKLKSKLLKRKTDAESQKHMQKQVRCYTEPPVIKSKNPLIPCAEDSIELQYNQKYGRHIIATRDIEIGEVLSVENSFCHVVHPKSKYLHCNECLELCYNMIPCENCSSALYCSEECRSKAFEWYHKYECQFPKILIHPTIMMLIKIALIGMNDSKKTKAELPNNVHRCDSFEEIMKLEMHVKERKYIKVCQGAIKASIAYHVLKENQEFASKYDIDEDDLNLKKLLFKAYMVTSMNAFLIGKMRDDIIYIDFKPFGGALYAFNSLFNHSCVPNSIFNYYGSMMVTRTQAPIKKGEQVTIAYGITFNNIPKAIRQKHLKEEFMFDCDCKACTHNWPTSMDLPFGKELPESFMLGAYENIFDGSKLNQKLVNKRLMDCKRLYNQLKRYEPCRTLLIVQQELTFIYNSQACREIKFLI